MQPAGNRGVIRSTPEMRQFYLWQALPFLVPGKHLGFHLCLDETGHDYTRLQIPSESG